MVAVSVGEDDGEVVLKQDDAGEDVVVVLKLNFLMGIVRLTSLLGAEIGSECPESECADS